MDAEDDHDRPQRSHQEAGHRRAEVQGGGDDGGQDVADGVGHRADDDEAEGHQEQDGEQGHQHAAEHLGDVLVQDLFQQALNKAEGDDGQHRAGVADHIDRDAQEGDPFRPVEGDDVGVDHGAGHRHRDKGLGAEGFGRGVSQEHRQEVEDAVAGGIEDGVGGALAAEDAQGGEQDQEALDQTGGGEGAHEGHEDAGDDVDKAVAQDGLFLAVLGGGGFGGFLAGGLDAAVAQHRLVGVGHVVADDHLVLAARLQHLQHALGLGQGVGVRLALVHQFEAEPCDTVGHRDDVALAADAGDDRLGQLVIILCHVDSSYVV